MNITGFKIAEPLFDDEVEVFSSLAESIAHLHGTIVTVLRIYENQYIVWKCWQRNRACW
jgi:hypothetical protein